MHVGDTHVFPFHNDGKQLTSPIGAGAGRYKHSSTGVRHAEPAICEAMEWSRFQNVSNLGSEGLVRKAVPGKVYTTALGVGKKWCSCNT